MNIIDELSWRGLIAQSTDLDALRAEVEKGPLTLYCGFDPTGPSLHAGHLIPLLVLKRFQLTGNRPIVLAGGATGLIGDPRDIGERVMNSEDTVSDWTERIGNQLLRFVELGESHTGAVVANNMTWTGHMTTVEFLRDVGKHFSLNTMLARDTVKRRLENEGISYTEFSYMLLQSNDYLQLRRQYNCRLQIGGSDQWGNIISGVELNRRKDSELVHALTLPLVTTADGKKFGKSTGGGSLWLDPEMTSPYAWYQYFLNTDDADVVRFLRWFTFLNSEEILEYEEQTTLEPHLRAAQRRLAKEMTALVHGEAAAVGAELASQALFGRGELSQLDAKSLKAALREVGTSILKSGEPNTIVDLLVLTGLCSSKGDARRTVSEGGAYVNNLRIADTDWSPSSKDYLYGKRLVLRRGKKSIAGIKKEQP